MVRFNPAQDVAILFPEPNAISDNFKAEFSRFITAINKYVPACALKDEALGAMVRASLLVKQALETKP